MCPRSPSQRVVELGFLTWEPDITATQVSSGSLGPPGPHRGQMGSRLSLELQVAAGGPLQVGSKAIRIR